MGKSKRTLKFKRRLQAPVEEVYTAFTKAQALQQWLCSYAQVQAKEGGFLFLGWSSGYAAYGKYLRLKPNRKIKFTWQGRGDPKATRVNVSLKTRQNDTQITLTHKGLGRGKKWKKKAKAFNKGWENALDNLQSLLETGYELNFIRRPLVGLVGIEEVTPELAEKSGLPVQNGLHIMGLVEEMGAKAAGLQVGDILVELDGKTMSGYESLMEAVNPHTAGDKVEAIYFRAGQPHRAEILLSPRPLPELPSSSADLLSQVREGYAGVLERLHQVLAEVPDEAASTHPAPEEWTVKQNLAHLIIVAHDQHLWLNQVLTGEEPGDNRPRQNANHPAYLQAFASVYPSTQDLLVDLQEELELTQELLNRCRPVSSSKNGCSYRSLNG